MELSQTSLPVKPGLRERKKQQTRDTIAKVALQLFAERGYKHTTLADIAEAANVSPRTIFAYFDRKEDILFCTERSFFDQLKEHLDERPAGTNTVDAFRDFLRSIDPPDKETMLRKRIIHAEEELRLGEAARHARIEELFADSIAKDLGAGPGDIRPALVAASITAAMGAMRDRLDSEPGDAISFEQGLEIFDDVLEFLRAGLAGLQRSQAS